MSQRTDQVYVSDMLGACAKVNGMCGARLAGVQKWWANTGCCNPAARNRRGGGRKGQCRVSGFGSRHPVAPHQGFARRPDPRICQCSS